jgi:hypothetical protein
LISSQDALPAAARISAFDNSKTRDTVRKEGDIIARFS